MFCLFAPVDARVCTMAPPSFDPAFQLSRRLLACILAFSLGWIDVSAQPASDKATSAPPTRRVIRVGASTDSYPYSYRDESGELHGYVVELLDAVARVMDLKIEREIAPGLEVNRRFTEGEFDVQQLFSYTPERASQALFSVPYLVVNGAVFARRDDNRFKSIDDLRRQRAIVATAGGPAADFAQQNGLAADQLRLLSTEEAVRQVSDGRSDVALLSRLTGLAQIHRLGIKNVAPIGPEVPRYPSRFCFAVHRDQEELMSLINEGLAILHQTGEFEAIHRRWFGRYEPTGLTPGQVIAYVASALALALAIALWALRRQRQLRRRIAGQADELAESHAILAEAQTFAQLGHWKRIFGEPDDVTWSNETFRIFERDPELGPPSSTDEVLSWVGGPDTARWRAAINDTLREHVPHSLDLTIEPRPGHRKTIHVRGRVVANPEGKVIGLFGTVQDITARRAAERALQQSEQRLRALYDNLPHALGVAERSSASWDVVSLNPEAIRMLGLDTAPILPCPFDRLGVAWSVQQQWQALFDRCASATSAFKVEISPVDTRRDLVATLVPLGSLTQPTGCCFLVEDVTDRKQKDAEIAQGRRLRALGELVGGIAHEFNNLLTPILVKADELREETTSNPRWQDDLSLISNAARRSSELTRRLLTFGRHGLRQPDFIDLRAIIDANVELLRQTTDRRIQIVCSVPHDLPRLFLCGNDVHQILLNLMINSRDTLVEKLARSPAADWTPRIDVTASSGVAAGGTPMLPGLADRDTVVLEVQDNGMGIPANVRERIFEPFYTTKEVGQGTGLGLATVWHLVSELGGRIDLESVPTEGTLFRVSLPATMSSPTPPPAKAARPSPLAKTDDAAGARPLEILVVEDEPAIARIISMLVHRRGHSATVALRGDEAWTLLSRSPGAFDAMIMDLDLPGLNGVELGRRAKTIPFLGPILVISGRVTEADRIMLAQLGINAVFSKPFTAEEFVTAFQTHIEHRA